MKNEYEIWEELKNNTDQLKDYLIYDDTTKPLHEIYSRKSFIYQEILFDLSPIFDDPQYCGTTSWAYEDELNILNKREEELTIIINSYIEEMKHKEFLNDINMTQDEYDIHLNNINSNHKNKKSILKKQ